MMNHRSKHLLFCLHIPLVKHMQFAPLDAVHATWSIAPCHAAAKTQLFEGQVIGSSPVYLSHHCGNTAIVFWAVLTASKTLTDSYIVNRHSCMFTESTPLQELVVLLEKIFSQFLFLSLGVGNLEVSPFWKHLRANASALCAASLVELRREGRAQIE